MRRDLGPLPVDPARPLAGLAVRDALEMRSEAQLCGKARMNVDGKQSFAMNRKEVPGADGFSAPLSSGIKYTAIGVVTDNPMPVWIIVRSTRFPIDRHKRWQAKFPVSHMTLEFRKRKSVIAEAAREFDLSTETKTVRRGELRKMTRKCSEATPRL